MIAEIKEIEELDLGRFKEKIDKSKLKLNEDGTYDYDGDLNFSKMNLKSFSDIPIRFRHVSGNFFCYQNQFTTLEDAPLKVDGTFNCYDNQLITLKGSPSYVGGHFACMYNNLISLQYSPLELGFGFDLYCFNNYLLSKVHLSKIDGRLDSDNNPFSITEEVIKAIKEMTIDQRVAELKFFKENDLDAYNIMLKAMNENDIGYGPKAKEMLELTESYDISNLV